MGYMTVDEVISRLENRGFKTEPEESSLAIAFEDAIMTIGYDENGNRQVDIDMVESVQDSNEVFADLVDIRFMHECEEEQL